MTKTILTILLVSGLAGLASAQPEHFPPGQLAVLRAGDGVVKQHFKQAPIFIDQFDPKTFNEVPSFTVAVPTNGVNSFFFNSHAATEGVLTRSPDHRLLVFAGYGGVNLLEKPGVSSILDIDRGFCTVDAAASLQTLLYQPEISTEKLNPRGGITDGQNNFWGAGNARATLYFNPVSQKTPLEFVYVPNTRALRIVDSVLYATLNGADAIVDDGAAGLYTFTDSEGNTLPLPMQTDAKIKLFMPVAPEYNRIAGFELNADKSVAYVSDTAAGVQKYVRSGTNWALADNFAIPQNIPAAKNHAAGCFGLAVDFSGSAPVIYATTTEGYNDTVNSNRVVRIVDTNATAVVSTIAQAHSTDIAFRGVDFTPEPGK